MLKPMDKAIHGMVSESPGRNIRDGRRSLDKKQSQRPSLQWNRRRQYASPKSCLRRGPTLAGLQPPHGDKDRLATGEALLALTRNGQRKVAPITGFPRTGREGERVAEGSVRAMKQGKASGATVPCFHEAWGGRRHGVMAQRAHDTPQDQGRVLQRKRYRAATAAPQRPWGRW
jgi:hypothetical protein